jgi:AcrR family transcriptional regulator
MPDHDQDAESVETPQKKRRRAPKGEMRRAALLDAATEIFARDGYGAASMRDVADIAGITTVGLLHHFPNKVSLLRALLDRRDQRSTERLGELEVSPTLEGLMAFLKLGMAISVQNLHECQAAMMINVESLSDKHPAYPWFKEKYEITHAHARAHLTTLVEQGEIRADIDVKALAIEIFSMMDGLQIQWLKSPGEVNAEATFDSYLQRLAASIRC